jgi:ATP-dependent Clp endopeptidase proteolytic subunit ClpP
MPYPNEHACRLESPEKYEQFRRAGCGEKHSGKCVDVIYGIDGESTERQSLRFKTQTWGENDARAVCEAEGGTFEPAAEEEAMKRTAAKTWFTVAQAEEGGLAEISIFDEIGLFGVSARDFKNELDSVKDSDEIYVSLNSPGGNFFDGMAIYQLLSSVRSKVTVEVFGLAASAASVIALAGRSLKMAQGSYYMIHNPYTIAIGDADELRSTADALEKFRDDIALIYSEKTGIDAEEMQELLKAETWYTAAEAAEAGFVDELVDYGEVAASYPDVSRLGFSNIPEPLASDQEPRHGIETVREFERFLRDAGFTRSEAERIAMRGFGAQGEPELPTDQGEPGLDPDEPIVRTRVKKLRARFAALTLEGVEV